MKTEKRNRDGVFIRRGSYWISFIDSQGRRKQRKLKGVTSLTTAKSLRAKELENAEKARTLGYAPPTEDTFAEFAPVYLRHQERSTEPSSYARTRGIVEGKLLPEFGQLKLVELRRIDARHYIDSRLDEVSKDTVIKEVNVLKALLNYAVEEEKIPFNPLARFGRKAGMPQQSDGRVRYVDGQQFLELLDACPEWLRPVTALLIATGMRRSELLTLCWFQVRRGENQIFLPKTKTHKERYVKLNALARAVLDTFTPGKPMERLFAADVSPYRVSVAFRRAVDKAGIVDFRLHDLRHSLASWMRMQGADLQDVAKQLGHTDLRMTNRYAHLSGEHMLAAVERVDSVFTGAVGVFQTKALNAANSGHDEVTIEQENSSKLRQTTAA